MSCEVYCMWVWICDQQPCCFSLLTGGVYFEASARENHEGVHAAFLHLCQEVRTSACAFDTTPQTTDLSFNYYFYSLHVMVCLWFYRLIELWEELTGRNGEEASTWPDLNPQTCRSWRGGSDRSCPQRWNLPPRCDPAHNEYVNHDTRAGPQLRSRWSSALNKHVLQEYNCCLWMDISCNRCCSRRTVQQTVLSLWTLWSSQCDHLLIFSKIHDYFSSRSTLNPPLSHSQV